MKKKKAKESVDNSNIPQVPEVEPGFVSFSLSKEELITFMNLMNITTQTFQDLATQAAQQNDQNSYVVLSARQKVSAFYADKLGRYISMPEPESRNIH